MMDSVADLVDTALASTNMDAVDALRAFFIFAACMIFSVSLPDSLRSRFIPYGARATLTAAVESETSSASTPASESKSTSASSSSAPVASSPVTRALDYVATLRVPHSYFTQFYVISVLSSIFWAVQLLSHGRAFQAIATRIRPDHLQHAISINQVMLCWGLMLIQGVRRLHECLSFSKHSSSKMWFVHWLAGLGFYLAVAVAVWIEGAGTVLTHQLSLADFNLTSRFGGRTLLSLPIFIIASGLQHDCHHYLFSLEKYTLPTHPMFSRILCPHYTAECMIYLSLALLAAPQGETVNKTLLSAVFFVAVNLGITASTTRQWYKQKFGEAAVKGKWNMIPLIY
ncbi:putative 3-oxo-5-alpha-steroid 4-dehydrogenase [Aspergillus undulatus]|uniref:putative 3-oxo-5-alpha-steroid 4-dehydrogenase n=1 Tax=Aspergillus undulatus TaxID=1810928 RepID=UPI003CCE43DD